MKQSLVIGAIAGYIVGLIFILFAAIFTRIRIIDPPVSLEIWHGSYGLIIVASMLLGVIWGMIFGAVYSLLYNCIPGKGVLKGLNYGIFIWLVIDIAASSFIALIGIGINYALSLIFFGFFMWVTYGLILGSLYKKYSKRTPYVRK